MGARRRLGRHWGMVMLLLLLAFAENVPADEGVAYRGMMFRQGILCTNPFVAKDLIDVINDAEVYRDWFMGYALSGYCVEWVGDFRLAQKLRFENTSFDGYRAELWMVRVPAGEEGSAILYGIVFPGALMTIGGQRS